MVSVSIVIPTFNRKKYLKKTIESIFSQTVLPDEIIVSDNASTDGTLEYLATQNQITINAHASQVSMFSNWVDAFSLSTKEYVVLLSDDDILGKDFVESIHNAGKSAEYALIIGKHGYITEDDIYMPEELSIKNITSGIIEATTFINIVRMGVPFRTCGVAFNRKLLFGIDLKQLASNYLYTAFDSEIIQRVGILGNSFILESKKPLVYYRVWNNSLTSKTILCTQWHDEIFLWMNHFSEYARVILSPKEIRKCINMVRFQNVKTAFSVLRSKKFEYSDYKNLYSILSEIKPSNWFMLLYYLKTWLLRLRIIRLIFGYLEKA